MIERNPADVLADRLDELRREMELRFSGLFVENAVNRLSAAANFLRQPTQTDALREALALARNRLQRVALELPHDSRSRIECNEWADEATSALEASNG